MPQMRATRSLTLVLLVLLGLAAPGVGVFEPVLRVIWQLARLKESALRFANDYLQFGTRELPDKTPSRGQKFDFIVVGAGSSGAVVAARLSEIPEVNVLLLEAGGNEDLVMDIPLLAPFLQLNKEINWDYKTDRSDRYCAGFTNQQCNVARGKVMGGTSVFNFMIAVRGNQRDYDEWYELTGDPNWSYEGMLKSFKKLENFDVNLAPVDRKYHNFDGPVRIANSPYVSPLARAFVKAGEELGLPPVDYNGRKQTGFSYMQTNQINGERLSSNRAYLHPVRNRPNLVVSMRSQVTKILIDTKTKTAYGVEYVKNGRRYASKVRREVILCAGAIATPQLLMLSGIGPANHLKSFGIDVLQDAPVGENMKDHVNYGGLFFFINETGGIVVRDFLNPANPTLTNYLSDRTGPLSSAGGIEALGYINVDDVSPNNEVPNIELMFGSVSIFSDKLIHIPFGVPEEVWERIFAPYLHRHAFLIWPVLMKPKSTGKILLKSSDPFDKPRIIPNYFSDPEDVRVSIKGIRLAIEVTKTKAMQRYGAQLFNYTLPGCEKYVPDSDKFWECALRTFTVTLWHNCGTAKMGREDDPTSVVNTKLEVKGIKRLRVADLSIMPNIVTAHTNIPALAIGEKFADILKKDWGFA